MWAFRLALTNLQSNLLTLFRVPVVLATATATRLGMKNATLSP